MFAIFFAFCLVSSMCCSVNASGTGGRSQVLPDPDLGGDGTILRTLNASSLTGLTHTSSFEKPNLPSGASTVAVSGNFKHTGASGLTTPSIRAGIGYYRAGTTTVDSLSSKDYFGVNVSVYSSVSVSSINNNVKYVGFVKNVAPSYGTVSGSLTVYTLN